VTKTRQQLLLLNVSVNGPICQHNMMNVGPCSPGLSDKCRTVSSSCRSSNQANRLQSWDVFGCYNPRPPSPLVFIFVFLFHLLFSWPKADAPSFAPLTPVSSLFWEQTLHLVTGVSRSRVREFGTVYPPHCGSLTLNLDTLNDFYRHFCLARPWHVSDTLISMQRV